VSGLEIGIVGAGARASVGRSLPACAAAVRARIGRVGDHPFLSDARSRPLKAARAEWLPTFLENEQRFVLLASNAAKEAMAGLRPDGDRKSEVRVFVGLPEARVGRPEGLDVAMADALGPGKGWRERLTKVTTIAGGHAAALLALESAVVSISSGESDLCLAGGVDSYLVPETMEWLEDARLLHRRGRPWGFTPGEGAAFCLLASPTWLSTHRVEAPLSIRGIGSANEKATIGKRRVCVGAGLSAAFEHALAPVRSEKRVLTRMIGDLNGEPYRVDELGFALTRISDLCARPGDILAPAQYWGDVGAASGALFAALAFESAVRKPSLAETTLMWTSSEGGRRAAALVRSNPRSEVS
jgi:3-oxoacyl-[acyl-carrier-protein] synthase-1